MAAAAAALLAVAVAGGRYAILAAGVTRGRVRDFHLSIGAAGE